MIRPMLQKLSEKEYNRLLEHASQEADFCHLGSLSASPGSGNLSGFACLSLTDHRHTLRSDSTEDDVFDAIHDIETTSSVYGIPSQYPNDYLTGGWVGLLSYEFGYLTEKRLAEILPLLPYPTLWANFYLWMASSNRRTGEFYLWQHPNCPKETIRQIEDWLATKPEQTRATWQITEPFEPTQAANDFKQSVEAVKRYIRAGDCYQVNLSQEFKGRFTGDSWQAYRALTAAHPTPFSAFLRHPSGEVLSISPERFLEISQGVVKTSPIKGTRARGASREEDHALANELKGSEKDRAENLMIVDLLRNDLGKQAIPGSVKVDQLFSLESFQNVHHLVSHIRAELKPGVSAVRALLDAFPGGSITGAPKIRAMEIIKELEAHWRGPYCGSVFYNGLDGRLDSNITIRTLLCDNQGTIRCCGGGGIVADSDPEEEYQETLAKVGPLMRFLQELKL